MKKRNLFLLMVILVGLAVLETSCQKVSADISAQDQAVMLPVVNQQSSPTLLPTAPPVILPGYPTPVPRVMPAVGSNAGLVIGASLLVLIIIGGILSTRRRRNH